MKQIYQQIFKFDPHKVSEKEIDAKISFIKDQIGGVLNAYKKEFSVIITYDTDDIYYRAVYGQKGYRILSEWKDIEFFCEVKLIVSFVFDVENETQYDWLCYQFIKSLD